jgi:hypothetical protein
VQWLWEMTDYSGRELSQAMLWQRFRQIMHNNGEKGLKTSLSDFLATAD